MFFSKNLQAAGKLSLLAMGIAALSACGSDSDDDDKIGYVKFYNASYDSPAIFMTLDEDLDEDDDDEFEQTFSSVDYASAGSRISLDPQDYFIELAWQDEESSVRSDLEIVFEDQIEVDRDVTKWVVMTESVSDPTVIYLDIPIIDDDEEEDDSEDDLFNLRFINLHSDYSDLDVYLSASDETFSEADLVDTISLYSLTENFKFDEDQYKLYVTEAGSTDVLFTSDEIDYSFGGQYLLSIRENQGVGGSPFVVDNMSNSSISQYDALESLANLSVYNGLSPNDLVPDYASSIDVGIDGNTDIPALEGLAYNEISEAYEVESGDYRFSIINDATDEAILENRILSLPQNTNRTLFLYWVDEAVDDDDDGVVDEDEDGEVDEYRAIATSLVIDNSDRNRLYDKEINILNLVTTDDFSIVSFYFVKSDEIIETAENFRNLVQGNSSSVILLNNTYDVFAVATVDGNEIILDELTLTLDEDTADLFLLLEQSDASSSGYALSVFDQPNASDDEE